MNIINLSEVARRRLGNMPTETVRDEVLRRLKGRVSDTVIAQAQARVDRLSARYVPRNVAVARVIAWALSSNDGGEAA